METETLKNLHLKKTFAYRLASPGNSARIRDRSPHKNEDINIKNQYKINECIQVLVVILKTQFKKAKKVQINL